MEGFFDKLVDKSKEVAQSVAKSTGELVDKGKTKVSLVQTQGALKELYRDFGEMMYRVEKGEVVDAGARALLVSKMDDAMQRIAELEAAEDAARKLDEQEQTDRAPAAEVCRKCGAQRIDGQPFCGMCGTKFD